MERSRIKSFLHSDFYIQHGFSLFSESLIFFHLLPLFFFNDSVCSTAVMWLWCLLPNGLLVKSSLHCICCWKRRLLTVSVLRHTKRTEHTHWLVHWFVQNSALGCIVHRFNNSVKWPQKKCCPSNTSQQQLANQDSVLTHPPTCVTASLVYSCHIRHFCTLAYYDLLNQHRLLHRRALGWWCILWFLRISFYNHQNKNSLYSANKSWSRIDVNTLQVWGLRRSG